MIEKQFTVPTAAWRLALQLVQTDVHDTLVLCPIDSVHLEQLRRFSIELGRALEILEEIKTLDSHEGGTST